MAEGLSRRKYGERAPQLGYKEKDNLHWLPLPLLPNPHPEVASGLVLLPQPQVTHAFLPINQGAKGNCFSLTLYLVRCLITAMKTASNGVGYKKNL